MGKRFQYEWNDFSGGLFVGPIGSKQPMNTFTGTDVMACATDGMLMPAGHLFEAHTSTPINNFDGRTSMIATLDVVNGSFLTYWTTAAAINYTNVGTWPTAVSTVATGENVGTSIVMGQRGQQFIFYPRGNGGAGIASFNYTTGAFNNNAGVGFGTGRFPNAIVVFGQFLIQYGFISAAQTQSFQFSLNPTLGAWSGTDFIDVCPVGQAIRTMHVQGSELMIGCTDGWYALSGVLGATATLRKINNDGVGASHFLCGAVARDGIVHSGPNHNGVYASILRGSTVYPLLYHRDDGETLDSSFGEVEARVVRSGAHILVGTGSASVSQRLFVRSANGTWRVHAAQIGAMAFCEMNWFKYGYMALYNGSNYILNRYELEPTSPVCRNSAGVWRTSSATATLSEYRHNTEFEVKEMIAEFEYGYGGDATTTRSIGVAALTRGVILEGTVSSTAFDAKVSSTESRTLTLSGAASNERGVQRFTPSDGGRTLTLSPKVTLQGIKLRRLIAICEEV